MYEPNAAQLQDILNNQIKSLRIREYKKDIIKLMRLYANENYQCFDDEQCIISWDGKEDVSDLLSNIAGEFSNYKEHLRLVIRLISKQHTLDARNQMEKFIKMMLK